MWNLLVLIIRKRSSPCEFDWEENPGKGLQQSKRESISLKWNLSIFVWDWKKCNWFKITVIIIRYIRNVNLLFKKDFKIAELLTKTSLFFTWETVLKMAKETNKRDVKSFCAKVTKHIKKMVWIWPKLTMNNWLWIVLIVCLYPRTI